MKMKVSGVSATLNLVPWALLVLRLVLWNVIFFSLLKIGSSPKQRFLKKRSC